MIGDLGAGVVRAAIARQVSTVFRETPCCVTGDIVTADLKSDQGLEQKQTLAKADVLIEGYRPGVTERLGLGPEGVRRSATGDLRADDRR